MVNKDIYIYRERSKKPKFCKFKLSFYSLILFLQTFGLKPLVEDVIQSYIPLPLYLLAITNLLFSEVQKQTTETRSTKAMGSVLAQFHH